MAIPPRLIDGADIADALGQTITLGGPLLVGPGGLNLGLTGPTDVTIPQTGTLLAAPPASFVNQVVVSTGGPLASVAPASSGSALVSQGETAAPIFRSLVHTDLLDWAAATADFQTVRSPVPGVVATRGMIPNTIYTVSEVFYTMTRTYHWARDDITSLQVVVAHWAVVSNAAESLPTGNLTITGSIEYPAGTFTQLKWGGSATGTATPGETLLTDALAVTIPFGAKFYVRLFRTCLSAALVANGLVNATLADVANGDATEFDNTDKTMSGTVIDAGGQFFPPTAIIGNTSRISVGLIGDGRVQGDYDTVDANVGDMGQFGRPLGKFFGYINLGISIDGAAAFVASGARTRTLALLAYVTHIVCNYGGMDFAVTGKSGDQVIALLQTLWAMLPAGKPVFQSTLLPISSSADGWTSGTQTPLNNAARSQVNTYILTKPVPLAGVFDVCPSNETAPGSGIWKYPNYTADGLTPLPLGYHAIVETGEVNASVLV